MTSLKLISVCLFFGRALRIMAGLGPLSFLRNNSIINFSDHLHSILEQTGTGTSNSGNKDASAKTLSHKANFKRHREEEPLQQQNKRQKTSDFHKTKVAVVPFGDEINLQYYTRYPMTNIATTRPARLKTKKRLNGLLDANPSFLNHIKSFKDGVGREDPSLLKALDNFEASATGIFDVNGKFSLPPMDPIGNHDNLVSWIVEEECAELKFDGALSTKGLWKERTGEQPFRNNERTNTALDAAKRHLTAKHCDPALFNFFGILESNQGKGLSFTYAQGGKPDYDGLDSNIVFESMEKGEDIKMATTRALQEELMFPQYVTDAMIQSDGFEVIDHPKRHDWSIALVNLNMVPPTMPEVTVITDPEMRKSLNDLISASLNKEEGAINKNPLLNFTDIYLGKVVSKTTKFIGLEQLPGLDTLEKRRARVQEAFGEALIQISNVKRDEESWRVSKMAMSTESAVLKHVARLLLHLYWDGFIDAKWERDHWGYRFPSLEQTS
jgi:hypothetical protein